MLGGSPDTQVEAEFTQESMGFSYSKLGTGECLSFTQTRGWGSKVELLTLVNSIWAPQKVLAPVLGARASRSHTFEPRQLLTGLVWIWQCGVESHNPPCVTTKLHEAVKKDY